MNTKEEKSASTSQTKEHTVNEKKLSAYSIKLLKECKSALPYMSNMKAAKKLMKAMNDYVTAYKKFGGQL